MSAGQNVNSAIPTRDSRAPQTPAEVDVPGASTARPHVRWSRRRGVVSGFAAFAAFAFVAAYVVEPSGAALAQSAPEPEVSTLYSVALDAPQTVQILAFQADEAAVVADLGRDGYVVELKPKPKPPPPPAAAPAPGAGSGSSSGWRPPFAVPDPGTAQAIAHQMVMGRGWGDDQFACLSALWQRESGWRVNAHNRSSGAYGIPQSLPGNKMASAGADWETNPATQITWGLGYITARYGTPCGAWEKSQRSGWY